MNKPTTIYVNFYIEYLNDIFYFMSKYIDKELLTEYILNYIGEIRIGRTHPKELDILFVTDDDNKEITERDILMI